MSPELVEQLRSELNRISAWKPIHDGVRVTTHVMYPSNGLVNVVVRGGRHSCVVSDDGGAIGEGSAVGARMQPTDRQLGYLVRQQGLSIKKGTILSPPVSFDAVPATILVVANAARDVANWLYDHANVKRHRDFRAALTELLRATFSERVHGGFVEGKRKRHEFAHVVDLAGGNKLIVDPVAREPSSINARVVSNLDVAQAEDPHISQRLVYDDEQEWTPDDLGLLGIVGVPVVPFSRSPQVIHRIASERSASRLV